MIFTKWQQSLQENDEMKKRHEMWELQQMQALPLKMKIKLTQSRIRQWVNEFGEDGVHISFSGGKDSTVLLDIVRKMYPSIKAVYVDTGLEYPEIKHFVKGFDNVEIIRPEMVFKDVITKYGYPMISKEVSECVQGARKYLTSILEEKDNLQSRAEQSRADGINTAIFTIKSQDEGNTANFQNPPLLTNWHLIKVVGGVRQQISQTTRNWRIF